MILIVLHVESACRNGFLNFNSFYTGAHLISVSLPFELF